MESLITSSSLLQAVKYLNVASVTVLVLDYVETFEREVSLIWTAKRGFGKCLFILARYPPLVDVPFILYYNLAPNVNYHRCLQVYSFSAVSTTLGISMAEAILVLRTCALSGQNRRVLACLLTLYLIGNIAVVVILVLFLRSLRYGASPIPNVLGCYATEGSTIIFLDFVIIMAFETMILVTTLWIGIKRFRYSRNPLVVTLFRDGILYYVALLSISSANVIVLAVGPSELSNLLNTFQRVLHSIFSARILLHVREKARVAEDLELRQREISTSILVTQHVESFPEL